MTEFEIRQEIKRLYAIIERMDVLGNPNTTNLEARIEELEQLLKTLKA